MRLKQARLHTVGFLGAAFVIAAMGVVALAPDAPRAQIDDLKPEVRYDVLKHQLQKAIEEKRHKDTVGIVARMRGTRFGVPGEALFYEGRAHFELKDWARAHGALVNYLNSLGRGGRNYKAAIALYVEAEGKLKAERLRAEELARAERSWRVAAPAYDLATQQRDIWKSKIITFGGDKDDMAWAIARRAKGGFIVGGTFEQVEDKSKGRKAGRRLWLAAIDLKGRMIWNQVLGAVAVDGSVRTLSPLADGGFLVGGIHAGFQVAARVDRNGAVISDYNGDPWISAYARSKDGVGGIVAAAGDGNFIAIGAETIAKDGKRPRLPFAVRLSKEGKTLGKTVYSGEGARFWHDMTDAAALSDGSVLAVGESRSQASWDTRPSMGYLLRVLPDGKLVWARRIPPESKGDMRLSAVSPSNDGGAIVAGHEGNALVILKVTKDGKQTWRKTIAPRAIAPEAASELCAIPKLVERIQASQKRRNLPLPDPDRIAAVRGFACATGTPFASAARVVPRENGYLVVGFQGRGTREKTDIRLIAVDEGGTVLWDRIFGHDGFDLATGALATEDGGFIIAGATDSVGAGGRDFLLFKVDSAGRFAPWAKLGPPEENGAAAPTPRAEGAGPEAKPTPAGPREASSPPDKQATKPEPGVSGEEGDRTGDNTGQGPTTEADRGLEEDEAVSSSAAPASGDPPETSFGSIFDSVFGGDEDDGPQGGEK